MRLKLIHFSVCLAGGYLFGISLFKSLQIKNIKNRESNEPLIAGAPLQVQLDLQHQVMESLSRGESIDAVAELLRGAIKTRANEVMDLIFHHLSASDSLRLIPLIAPALAKLPDKKIDEVLSGARTNSELQTAWRAVVADRARMDPISALQLALLAPPKTEMESFITAACLRSTHDPLIFAEMLSHGLPTDWAINGIKTSNITSVKPFIIELNNHLSGKWSATEIAAVFSNLPETATDKAELLPYFSALPSWKLLSGAIVGKLAFAMANQSREHQNEFLATLPEGFLRSKAANTMAKEQALNQAARNINTTPNDSIVDKLETVSAARDMIASVAELRAAAGKEDQGKGAIKWALSQSNAFNKEKALNAVTDTLLNTQGPLTTLQTLDSAGLDQLGPQYGSAVRTLIDSLGPHGFSEQEHQMLSQLTNSAKQSIKDALILDGKINIAEQIK